jgi:hypothetical protein
MDYNLQKKLKKADILEEKVLNYSFY